MSHEKNYTPWIVLGVVVLFGFILISMVVSSYNGIIKLDEAAQAQWANVETSYQRRFDLIPNLVETVKGAAEFEKDTFTEVTKARSQWANADNTNQKVNAANGMESALSRLMVVVERYPNLKATQAYRDMMVQLEGTENRINVERKRYNDAVKQFNTKIRTFPNIMVANVFGFEKKELFESVETASEAPEVNFTEE